MLKVHAMGEYSVNTIHDVAYIRLIYPLRLLEKQKLISLSENKSYVDNKNSQVFFVQRTWRADITQEEADHFIWFIKENNKKLIYEIDDNLLDMDSISNKHKNIIRILAKNANFVIVPTQNLKKRMEPLNRNIVIIPNFLSLKNITRRNDAGEEQKARKIKIGYMGTPSHQKDFQMIKLPLMKLLHKYEQKVELEIIGAVPEVSTFQNMSNVFVHSLGGGRSSYSNFWKWMNEKIYWDIGLAPLKLDEFTCCKSDIKYLDYSALRIAGIFSNHPSYSGTVRNRENGLLVDNIVEKWYEALEEMILNETFRSQLAENAYKDLYENRLLEQNYEKWMDVLSK